MSATGGFDQSVRHQRAGRNDRVHDAAIDQLGDHQALLGHGHRAGECHDDEAFLVARHGLEHVGSFAELAAGKRGPGHGAHQVVDGVNLAGIERLQRNQPVRYRIVQLAVDARALVMMAVVRDIFLLQGKTSRMKICFDRRNNLLEVRKTRRTAFAMS